MSQMVVKGHRGRQFKLNVTQFRSPMSAAINSVQTRKMLHHFPIRAGQPDINFTVKFRSQEAKKEFQDFVRDHQTNAQSESGDLDTAVVLWWPERNIENWSGFITEYRVVERGYKDPAPSVTFGVTLIDSLMSEHTTLSSFAARWTSILGPQIGPYKGLPGSALNIENLLRPPTPPRSSSPETSSPTGGNDYPNPPGPYFGGQGNF